MHLGYRCYNRITKIPKSIFFVSALLLGCSGATHPPVEDVVGHENLPQFKLQSLRGTRDGDRLRAQAMFSDSSSILTVDMTFTIGSPTKLESGSWRWMRNSKIWIGTVAGKSVTFLGGQDGPPSIGGTFELLGQDGAAHYRAAIPLTELKAKL